MKDLEAEIVLNRMERFVALDGAAKLLMTAYRDVKRHMGNYRASNKTQRECFVIL
jgi:hypothetical protein